MAYDRTRKLSEIKDVVVRMSGTAMYTQTEIAEYVGVTPGRVSQILAEHKRVMPDRLDAALEQREQLRALKRVYWGKAIAGDDYSARTLLKICEREARLLGLDAPTTIAAVLEAGPVARYVLEMDETTQKALS